MAKPGLAPCTVGLLSADLALLHATREQVIVLIHVLGAPHAAVAAAGADEAVATMCGGLLWLMGAWLAALLALGLAAALPGIVGAGAHRCLVSVAPAAVARFVAVVTGSVLAATPSTAASAATPSGSAGPAPVVPISVAAAPLAPPVLPTSPETSHPNLTVVVRPGDSLWSIARDRLPQPATDRAVASAVMQWYLANRAVVGADPALILPGQHLQPPSPPEQP